MTEYEKGKLKVLIISLLNVGLLSIGHAGSSRMLLIGSLLVFFTSALLWRRDYFLPLMLFYLPWSPVLKTNPQSYTFFTLIVPPVFIVIFLEVTRKNEKFKVIQIVISLLFFAYTMIVKMFNQLPVKLSYMFFIMMLFFIPLYIRNYKQYIRFERCVLFLTSGILSACIASEILMQYPHMLQYIDIYKWEQIGLIRLSGFYGDANYYSAQILVALAGLLIVLGKTTKKPLIALQVTAIIALLYFGMLSVSKMFIICTSGLAVLWMVTILIEKHRVSYKLALVSAAVVMGLLVAASNIFSDEINLYFIRFGMITDISSLTTGRSKLMGTYLNYLLLNIDKLFFGIGLSQDQVRLLLGTNNAHNTIIETVYQTGIIGSVLLVWWWKTVYTELADKSKMDFLKQIYFMIMTASVILPWLSLDILYFDEFFYFTLLILLSKEYLSENINLSNCVGNFKKVGELSYEQN